MWYDLLDAAKGVDASLLASVDCNEPFKDSGFASVSNRDIAIAGIKGVAFLGTAPRSADHSRGMWQEDRCLVVKQRLYHLTAVGPDTQEMHTMGIRFLDSFSLQSSPGP